MPERLAATPLATDHFLGQVITFDTHFGLKVIPLNSKNVRTAHAPLGAPGMSHSRTPYMYDLSIV